MISQVISHYRLIERLGVGGAGEVYLAQDLRLGRKVALKFLSSESLGKEPAATRLFDEARAAAALDHPHICAVYEVGEVDGSYFLVMQYIEGETLAAGLRTGAPDLAEALNLAMQIAEALVEAHSQGIVHGDIKPQNIMVTRHRQVKLMDFGLARVVAATTVKADDADSSHLSGDERGLSGTLAYLSPEQLCGEPLQARSDIFSFGVVLYEILAGRNPFARQTPAAVEAAILSSEPTPLGVLRNEVPLELESLVRRALEKDPERRYQAVDSMLAELRQISDQLQAGYRKASEATGAFLEAQASQPRQGLLARVALRRRWFFVVGILLALVAVGDGAILQGSFLLWGRDAALLLMAAACLLGYAALRRKGATHCVLPERAAAFRGLLPFQETDRERFYGRDGDTPVLFEKVVHSEFRLGVLFGESGCGKTSLIRAGLIPRLWEAGYVPIYCRSYKDPLAALLEECRRQTQVARRDGEEPIEYLRRAAQSESACLIIICDQFEEFFVNFKTAEQRLAFTSLVASCYADSALPVKFLLSMRSDFLYQISAEFGERIAEPLLSSRLFHLRNFDVEKAALVIEKSARQAGVPFEAGLVRHLARDLAVGGVVLPSELQIVGERLQSKRIHTVQAYRRAGGKEPLMHSFLEDLIESSGDGDGARLLLRTLISEENTRTTLPLDEIVKRTQRSRATVERLLTLFVKSRLIREIQEDEPWRYELMHEYLIEKINQITGRVMDATQRANRLLRQYLSSYMVDPRARIPLGKLLFIHRYADTASGERARELLRKSLRRGLTQAVLVALLLAAGTILAAAALSISEEWEERRLKDGHRAAVRRAAFSPDGRLLVSVGEDQQVIVWDFARRERLATFNDHTQWVTSVAFSPDGKWFVTGSYDRTAIVWDAERLQKFAVLSDHPNVVNAVAFSPDGRLLVTSCPQRDPQEASTILWRPGTWEKIGEYLVGSSETGSLLFSRDSQYIIFHGASPNTWELATMRPVADRFDLDWGGNNVALSPDARLLVSVTGDGVVIFADMRRRQTLSRFAAHQDNGRATAFSPDGKLAATGAEVVILWDAITRQKIAPLDYPSIVWSVTFSPDGRWLVSTHGDGTIQVWDVAERRRVIGFNEHSDSVRTVVWSPDGKRVASAGEDRSIIVWNSESGHKEAVLMGHPTRVVGASFSPDGTWMASVDRDGLVIVWNLAKRQPQFQFAHPKKKQSHGLAVSPEGRWVATSHGVYESATGHVVADFAASDSDPRIGCDSYGMAFSRDGKLLAHTGPYLTLLDTTTWQVIDYAETEIKSAPPLVVSFSPDGKWLVTGEDQRAVRLWAIEPLKEVAVLGYHQSRIKSVAFSHDGRQVVSAGDDQTISLWEVSGRRLVTRIGTHTAPVLSVAFSPDATQLVSGEHDRSVRLYTRYRTLWGWRLD